MYIKGTINEPAFKYKNQELKKKYEYIDGNIKAKK